MRFHFVLRRLASLRWAAEVSEAVLFRYAGYRLGWELPSVCGVGRAEVWGLGRCGVV